MQKRHRRSRYPFADSESVEWLKGGDHSPEHLAAVESVYRRYLSAFGIPKDLIDPDVVFGNEDLLDARRAAVSAEQDAECTRSIYSGELGLDGELLRPSGFDQEGQPPEGMGS